MPSFFCPFCGGMIQSPDRFCRHCGRPIAGKRNVYGHPDSSTIANLCQVGATIYGTDVHGTVVVTADSRQATVATAHDAPPLTCPQPALAAMP